jgi:hypothetical protein
MGLLATFDKVQGDAFIRTTKAAQDMATFMGTDLQSAMQTLGRALQDPEAGMMALRRANIILTDAQKEQIKSMSAAGDIAGAQGVILAAVEGKYGGAAQKLASPFKQFENVLGDIAEAIGRWLTPAMREIVEVGEAISWWFLENEAVIQGWADWVGECIATVTDPIEDFFYLVTQHSEVAWAFAWVKVQQFIDRVMDGFTILGRVIWNVMGAYLATIWDEYKTLFLEGIPALIEGLVYNSDAGMQRMIAGFTARLTERLGGVFTGVTEGLGQNSAQTEAAEAGLKAALDKAGVSSIDELLEKQNAIDASLAGRPSAASLATAKAADTIAKAADKLGEVTSIAFDKLSEYFQKREEKKLQEEAAKAAKESEKHLGKIADQGVKVTNLDELSMGWE